MELRRLKLAVDSRIARVTLNRPDVRNAFSMTRPSSSWPPPSARSVTSCSWRTARRSARARTSSTT